MLPPPVALPRAVISKKGNPARLEDMSNIPRYPPFMEGLPVHSPAALLATQQELTRGIQQLIANRELLEAHYNPSMLRLAEFVQLLPASQSHHHRGAGGMLRHSLEVGFWALQQTEGKLIRGVITPQQRRLIEPRWRLAAFLAGICHDLGKVVTDLTVTDRAGEEKWRPYKYGIYRWAESNRIENYFLHWTEGRGKNHTNVSSTLIDAVITKESFDWIGAGSTDAVIWLTESLNNNPGSSNQIHNFVVKADQLSVERDLKSMGAAMAGYEIGVPIERYLTDIMRRLVQESIWRINEPGARIWNLNGTTYLVWPMAGEEISRRTRDEDIPGLPKTPDGILDMMVEREIAFLREDGGGDSFFYIAPDIITEKIPAMRLKAIRLRDQALISSMPIPPVPGKIYLNKSDASPETNTPVAPLPDIAANPAPVAMDDRSAPVERLDEPANAIATKQSFSGAPVARPSKKRPGAAQLPLIPDEVAEKAPALIPEGLAVAPVEPTETIGAPITPAGAVMKNEPPSLESAGAIGELLRVLIKEFQSGQKSFSELGIRLPDGGVFLKWPDAFAGYGFTPKQILNDLTETGWLVPASEVATIGDAGFSGGVAKALRLTGDVGALFVVEKSPPTRQLETPPKQQTGTGAITTDTLAVSGEISQAVARLSDISDADVGAAGDSAHRPAQPKKQKRKSRPEKKAPQKNTAGKLKCAQPKAGWHFTTQNKDKDKGKSIEKAC